MSFLQTFIVWAGARGLLNGVPDELYLKTCYRLFVGKQLKLESPTSFSEKLQWLKLHDRNPIYTDMVDKYKVKDWVANVIGSQYVIPTIDVWDSVDMINFTALPERFVLKTNHDSGGVFICDDKTNFNENEVILALRKRLNRNYFWLSREWPYLNVKPVVFAEEFMTDCDDSDELSDYKVMCFSGEAKLIQVHRGRSVRHTQNYYDTDWNELAIAEKGYPASPEPQKKPKVLDEMIELSSKLAEGIPQVRVDWYMCNGELRFGEMTFYDSGGFNVFENPQDDETIGAWIDLSMAYDNRWKSI